MTKEQIIRDYGSLALAYIGDAAYELKVREYVLNNGVTVNGKMHKEAKKLVSAMAQSDFLFKLMPYLTEDEIAVAKRGRNTKTHSHSKNADITSYHNATGFEALWGYLYLQNNTERMDELFNIITVNE